MILLLFFSVSVGVVCRVDGSPDDVQHKSVCEGKIIQLPSELLPPLYTGPVYFRPNDGGPRREVMDNGKAKDPRIRSYYDKAFYLGELNEKDNGTFSIRLDDNTLNDVLILEILDCPIKIIKTYWSKYEYTVPARAEFLEFTPPQAPDQLTILWNQSDPQINDARRGRVKQSVWEISDLTQADNGYYSFRRHDRTLESKLHLMVEENFQFYDDKDQKILIKYPRNGVPWTVTFKPENKESESVMEAGQLVSGDNWFSGRIFNTSDGIEINPVEDGDTGHFEFKDPQGNLALKVFLSFSGDEFDRGYALVGVLVAIVAMVILGCIIYFCKKRGQKDNFTPQTTVQYHDANQTAEALDSANELQNP